MAQDTSPRKGAGSALHGRSLQGMAVLGGAVLLGSTFLMAPATAQTVNELQAQIADLSQRIDELQGESIAIPVIAPAQAVTAGDFPRSIKLPGTNTSFSVSGYIKAEAMITDDAVPAGLTNSSLFGGVAALDGSTADDRGWDTRLTAYQTRFRIQTRTPSDLGEVKTYIETDFRGHLSSFTSDPTNAHTLRLRHAYGTLGNFLAGQTWDAGFMLFATADTIDFNGPRGVMVTPAARTPQFRYTIPFSGGSFKIALHDNFMGVIGNAGALTPAGAALGAGIETLPELVANVTFGGSWGTAGLSGWLEHVDTDCGGAAGCVDESDVGWMLGVGARVPTWGRDSLAAMVGYGEGMSASYSGGGGGSVDFIWDPFTGDFEEVETIQFSVHYEHWWQDNLRSTAAYGLNANDNDCSPFVGPGVACTLAASAAAAGFLGLTETAQSVHVNLIWTAVKGVDFGIEWSYFWTDFEGDTDGAGPLGNESDINRIQLMAKFSF